MRDRREQILDRLMELFPEVPGIVKIGRNVEDVSGGMASRPALIMHDGSEEPAEWSNRPRGATKELVSLKPQILILWGDKAELVATKVNELRRYLIKTIWTDAVLKQICGNSKDCDVIFSGCGLETYQGETREARMLINFTFIYLLDCNELV